MSYDPSVFPFSAVCYITDVVNGVSLRGSGVLISPDCVLTAAHVVWDSGSGKSASQISVSPGYGGSRSFGTVMVTNFSYNQISDANDSISEADSQNDFALLHLATPIAAAGTMGLQTSFAGGTATIAGYPVSYGTSQVSAVEQVTRDSAYNVLDFSGFTHGASGGPIWVGSAANPQVVGLVSSQSDSGSNYGALITPGSLAEIRGWLAAFDGVATASKLVPNSVYRFFDTKFGTHFFTADGAERDTILATRPDLTEERNGFGTVTAGSAGAAPVYRFFDSIHGTHFFTASTAERDSIVKTRSDLQAEPSATFQEHLTQQAGDVAVYRFFDTHLGTHFYTGDASERTAIITPGASGYRPDLKDEGVGFYAPSGNYF